MVRALACHARGRGFESRHSRRSCRKPIGRPESRPKSKGWMVIDLRVIVGSVREARVGFSVARWFVGVAESGPYSEGRRLSYYRNLALRNWLIEKGIPASQIRMRIADVDSGQPEGLVRLSALQPE